MNKNSLDIVASVYTRLSNEARRLKRPFGEMLQYYGMERFLYRLSRTQYADNFILKGGLVFYCWNIPLRRSTKDIDFLGILDNQEGIIRQIIIDSMAVSVPDDGVNFDPATLVIEETQVDSDRKGIRAKFIGYLGRSEMYIQIDFGFSDQLVSDAEAINYPAIISGMANPQIRGYPVESVVAEKIHIMQRFAEVPSRWKDYYDVWLISEQFRLNDQLLKKAIVKTFENRKTELPNGRPYSLSIEFAQKYNENWKSFVKKNDLGGSPIELPYIVDSIWNFLEWPLQGLKSPRVHSYSEPKERKWR